MPKIKDALPVYGASQVDLHTIQCFLKGCNKRRYTSELIKVQLTPHFFFLLNEILSSCLLVRKHFYHSVFPYFFIIFQSLKFWRFLRPVPSSVENGSECYCDVIEGARLSRSTRTSLEIFLLLFSVVAEQPILEEVSGFTEFLSLVIHGRKALRIKSDIVR